LHCNFAGTSRPAIASDEPELGEANGGVANVYYQSNAQARNSPVDYLGEGCGWWLSPGAGQYRADAVGYRGGSRGDGELCPLPKIKRGEVSILGAFDRAQARWAETLQGVTLQDIIRELANNG